MGLDAGQISLSCSCLLGSTSTQPHRGGCPSVHRAMNSPASRRGRGDITQERLAVMLASVGVGILDAAASGRGSRVRPSERRLGHWHRRQLPSGRGGELNVVVHVYVDHGRST